MKDQNPPQEFASETVDQRIGPALKIIKDLLSLAEQKRAKAKADAETVEATRLLAEQNAQAVMETPELYYVAMDGDSIGNEVARSEMQGDEQKIADVSARIEAGTAAFIQWAMTNAGKKIQSGGDEAMVKVPSIAMDKLGEFIASYKQIVGATVTIGVGKTIPESINARMLGKLRGKNTVVFYDENTEKELNLRLQNKDTSEEQKIREVMSSDEQDRAGFDEYMAWQQSRK